MDDVTPPPELERFAAEAVATSRYRDMSHALAGLRLLQRQDEARAELLASVLAGTLDRRAGHTDGRTALTGR